MRYYQVSINGKPWEYVSTVKVKDDHYDILEYLKKYCVELLEDKLWYSVKIDWPDINIPGGYCSGEFMRDIIFFRAIEIEDMPNENTDN